VIRAALLFVCALAHPIADEMRGRWCVTVADECRAWSMACDRGGNKRACSQFRRCIARLEDDCNLRWW
jgi:hypothetical protein